MSNINRITTDVCVFTGDAMNNFINENWSLVQQEIGKPIYVALARVANDIISNVARKVPYKELFAD
jgi:hypothetical protein